MGLTLLAVNYWPALMLSLLVLALAGLFRQQPCCPACGSRQSQAQGEDHVRLCRNCLNLYKTREA